MEPETVFAEEQVEIFNRLQDELMEHFPQFQDDVCVDLMEEVCDTHGSTEGTCCLKKRRRIMEDAAPLADAWESADVLKKLFRRGEVPLHFLKVARFLEQ